MKSGLCWRLASGRELQLSLCLQDAIMGDTASCAFIMHLYKCVNVCVWDVCGRVCVGVCGREKDRKGSQAVSLSMSLCDRQRN